jgi:hypothetical protein
MNWLSLVFCLPLPVKLSRALHRERCQQDPRYIRCPTPLLLNEEQRKRCACAGRRILFAACTMTKAARANSWRQALPCPEQQRSIQPQREQTEKEARVKRLERMPVLHCPLVPTYFCPGSQPEQGQKPRVLCSKRHRGLGALGKRSLCGRATLSYVRRGVAQARPGW